ncbi:MAG: response regulator transcription factor [Deltaproteobacteria bacterium]
MTRILLVDDHKIVRDGLRSLIERQPGMQVVGEASTGYEMLELASRLSPDVVVVDVSMPELNGVEATRRLSASGCAARVVALSVHTDRRYVTKMFEAGAVGYLPKSAAFDELALAIAAVTRGQVYLSPSITGVVLASYLWGADAAPTASLTAREREVLQLLAEGLSSKEIASRLTVAVTTVETHRRHIGERLGIHNIAGLTKYAIREGLTTLGE